MTLDLQCRNFDRLHAPRSGNFQGFRSYKKRDMCTHHVEILLTAPHKPGQYCKCGFEPSELQRGPCFSHAPRRVLLMSQIIPRQHSPAASSPP